MHELLHPTDTASSDVSQLTPLITEVYMQIHKLPDVHPRSGSTMGNKHDFLCAENDRDFPKSALIASLIKKTKHESQAKGGCSLFFSVEKSVEQDLIENTLLSRWKIVHTLHWRWQTKRFLPPKSSVSSLTALSKREHSFDPKQKHRPWCCKCLKCCVGLIRCLKNGWEH